LAGHQRKPGQTSLGRLRTARSRRGCLHSPVNRGRGKHAVPPTSRRQKLPVVRFPAEVPEHSARCWGRILSGCIQAPAVRMGISQSYGNCPNPVSNIRAQPKQNDIVVPTNLYIKGGCPFAAQSRVQEPQTRRFGPGPICSSKMLGFPSPAVVGVGARLGRWRKRLTRRSSSRCLLKWCKSLQTRRISLSLLYNFAEFIERVPFPPWQ
jgi:hypothetical protein